MPWAAEPTRGWACVALRSRWEVITNGVNMIDAAGIDMQISGALIELFFGIHHSTWNSTRYLGYRGQLLKYWLT